MKSEYEEIIKKIHEVNYPHRHDIENEAYENLEASFSGTVAELKAAKEKVKNDCNTIFKKQMDNYHVTIDQLEKELKDAVHEDIGFSDEVFDVMWAAAYQRGHSSGYNDIIIEIEDMYDSVNKIVKSVTKDVMEKTLTNPFCTVEEK